MKRKAPACLRCGRCCQTMILEATEEDSAREPRIAAEGLPFRDCDGYCLNSPKVACVFLRDGNRCDIYATRPDMCRGFRPGCTQCRARRKP